VLGDPRIALTWIANELSLAGDCLAHGDTITTGTCVVPVSVMPR
jgi:2-keto-4-pentenoate hydratase